MAIRTTSAEVLQIMDNCTVSTTIIDSFITSASALIDKVFEYDINDMPSTLLEEMERWLTAHMIASSLQRTTDTERLGDAEVKYTGKWGENLGSTPYGQMVMTLDYSGRMKSLGKGRAGIHAVPQFDD
jgi:hypothetical protein